MAQRLDENLTCGHDDGRTPTDDIQRHFGKAERGHLWLVDPGETEKRPADKELIRQGVDGAAETAGDLEAAGQVAVDDIRQAGDHEQDKGTQEQVGGLFADVWRIEYQAQENERQHQPPDSQGVGDVAHDGFCS